MTVRDRILLTRAGVSLHCGDALEVLRGLPAESVQCCITSPPYWGPRNYKSTPAVWRGERECNLTEHHWGGGQFCLQCGAWCGELGLEPTSKLFIAHLVLIFREVLRVLKRSGTCWIVVGDSYNAYNGNRGKSSGPNKNYLEIQQRLPSGYGLTDKTLKPKDLIGIPWMLAFTLRDDGWYWRNNITWAKPNPMPESVTDRLTRSSEVVLLMTKSARYHFDSAAISEPIATNSRENYPARAKVTGRGSQGAAVARGNDRDKSGGFPPRRSSGNLARVIDRERGHLGGNIPWEGDRRNKRDVWWIPTKASPWGRGLHFAAYPEALVEPMVLAGSKPGDVVLDPFMGSGTTGAVAIRLGRKFVGIDLKPEYADIGQRRLLAEVAK